ncbi:MAG: TIGR03643 family protein [Chitinophagaceae bacterium]|nr:TIGR03643 family protein [Chitinophagaceae bacterium]
MNLPNLDSETIDRILEMAWEDRTPFEAIQFQFGLSESAVRKLMKKQLRFSSYRLWRMRVEACSTKHLQTRTEEITRFRCKRQRTISNNAISKRKRR